MTKDYNDLLHHVLKRLDLGKEQRTVEPSPAGASSLQPVPSLEPIRSSEFITTPGSATPLPPSAAPPSPTTSTGAKPAPRSSPPSSLESALPPLPPETAGDPKDTTPPRRGLQSSMKRPLPPPKVVLTTATPRFQRDETMVKPRRSLAPSGSGPPTGAASSPPWSTSVPDEKTSTDPVAKATPTSSPPPQSPRPATHSGLRNTDPLAFYAEKTKPQTLLADKPTSDPFVTAGIVPPHPARITEPNNGFLSSATPKNLGAFPTVRPRRTRQAQWIRRLTREARLWIDDLILPIFVRDPLVPERMDRFSYVKRYTLDELPELLHTVNASHIPAVAFFPVIPNERRTPDAAEAANPHSIIYQAIRMTKEITPQIGVLADITLDTYTTHGQDGLMIDGRIDNDTTLEVVQLYGLLLAQAGVNMLMPSNMMDGCVGALRAILDHEGFQDVGLMACSVKYNSSLYGPHRDAVLSRGCLRQGDKKTYYMDPCNKSESFREMDLDVQEGADMLLVRPSGFYLDIIQHMKQRHGIPCGAFQILGEYGMICAASQEGWVTYSELLLESLLAFKRAGADFVITYGALDAAQALIRQTRSDLAVAKSLNRQDT